MKRKHFSQNYKMLLLTQIKLFLDNYLCIYFHVLYLFFMNIYNISKTKFPCQRLLGHEPFPCQRPKS